VSDQGFNTTGTRIKYDYDKLFFCLEHPYGDTYVYELRIDIYVLDQYC
jgi:hypothetical protein